MGKITHLLLKEAKIKEDNMSKAVIKSASYVLVHTPDMIYNNGTTTQTELKTNPNSEFLKDVKNHFRSYEEVTVILSGIVLTGHCLLAS